MTTNDNSPDFPGILAAENDAHGQAALLLTESLIHGLCEKFLISTVEALEIVDRAIDVQFERAEAADEAGTPMWRAHGLLSDIAGSLRTDIEVGPLTPRLAW